MATARRRTHLSSASEWHAQTIRLKHAWYESLRLEGEIDPSWHAPAVRREASVGEMAVGPLAGSSCLTRRRGLARPSPIQTATGNLLARDLRICKTGLHLAAPLRNQSASAYDLLVLQGVPESARCPMLPFPAVYFPRLCVSPGSGWLGIASWMGRTLLFDICRTYGRGLQIREGPGPSLWIDMNMRAFPGDRTDPAYAFFPIDCF